MEKMRDVIGLPVLETKSGAQIGEVHEAIVNLAQARLWGVLICGPTWFTQERGILFGDIFGIGRDAVTIAAADVVQDFAGITDDPEFHQFGELSDKELFTETGLYLGTLIDLLYDPVTGEVRFFEVSDGFVSDFLHGRLVMPLPQAQVVNGERLIVPEAMARLLHAANQESGGG